MYVGVSPAVNSAASEKKLLRKRKQREEKKKRRVRKYFRLDPVASHQNAFAFPRKMQIGVCAS